jgi:hypothetical protein
VDGGTNVAIDTTTPTSRRALLAGIAGSLVATVAGGIGRAQPAAAATPYVELGGTNTAATVTDIRNTSTNGYGFSGHASGSGWGVSGDSPTGIGVFGSCPPGYGVYGQSSMNVGVGGFSTSGYGVYGYTESGAAPASVGLSSGDNTGVQGYSGSNGLPVSPDKTGVHGYADTDAGSVGVRGNSPTGRGGLFGGKRAQLRLLPSPAATHPASGSLGDLFLDKSKRLWFCKGGTTWKQIA